jgi:hypothetical protein
MSYYIIPKINSYLNVNPQKTDENNLTPYISASLFKYQRELCEQITKYLTSTNSFDLDMSYNEVVKIVNPYEYIFSKVPGSKFSVSKLKPQTNLFYDFLEVSITLNIFEPYKNKNIKTLHLTHNNSDSIECFEMLRENYGDEIIYYDEINDEVIGEIGDTKFEFLFFEANIDNYNSYICSLINFIMIISLLFCFCIKFIIVL